MGKKNKNKTPVTASSNRSPKIKMKGAALTTVAGKSKAKVVVAKQGSQNDDPSSGSQDSGDNESRSGSTEPRDDDASSGQYVRPHDPADSADQEDTNTPSQTLDEIVSASGQAVKEFVSDPSQTKKSAATVALHVAMSRAEGSDAHRGTLMKQMFQLTAVTNAATQHDSAGRKVTATTLPGDVKAKLHKLAFRKSLNHTLDYATTREAFLQCLSSINGIESFANYKDANYSSMSIGIRKIIVEAFGITFGEAPFSGYLCYLPRYSEAPRELLKRIDQLYNFDDDGSSIAEAFMVKVDFLRFPRMKDGESTTAWILAIEAHLIAAQKLIADNESAIPPELSKQLPTEEKIIQAMPDISSLVGEDPQDIPDICTLIGEDTGGIITH